MDTSKETEEKPVINKRDFMCTCSEKSKQEAEACHERVLKELDCTPEDFMTKVVYELHWGLNDGNWHPANIEAIYCDMWCGVSVIVQRNDSELDEFVDHAKIWVECDRVEHGIARAYELAKEVANPEQP